jgi:predicted metal-dependent peptidase
MQNTFGDIMMKLTAKEKIIRARVKLLNDEPFFGRLLMEMKFEESERCGTMGVNRVGKCFYNPSFVDSLTEKELKGVICHELLHVILKHVERGKNRGQKLFNVAVDLVVNDILNENGHSLPEGGLIPMNHKYTLQTNKSPIVIKDIDKRGAESIYEEIRDGVDENDNGSGEGGSDLDEGFDEHLYGEGGEDGDEDVAGRDGDYWKGKIVEAQITSKMAGKSPLGMDRIINELVNPKLPWNKILAKYVRENIPYDFTWKIPNKKTYSTGVYLPNTNKEGVKVLFLIDTSGSMDDDDLKICFSEINGVVKSIRGVSLSIVYHDTKVYEGSVLTNPNAGDIAKELRHCKGGGGTDFNTAYKWILDKRGNYDVVIHLTDGYDTFPQTPLKSPLIICLQKDGKEKEDVEKECKYATVVKIR